MINRLLNLFRIPDDTSDHMEPALAAAALMFEVVWADHDIGEAEISTMSAALRELFDLNAERLSQIVEQTRKDHEHSVGLYEFTRAINEQLDEEGKFEIMIALWQIALADKQIDRFEEHMIRRVAELLYVPHERFIEAKLTARNH